MSVHPPVLPTAYLPDTLYYQVLLEAGGALIEHHEHFVKQSYRSRCTIAGVNGPLDLIVPLRKWGNRTPIKDVRITYSENWQKLHWKSLESAYRSSPYFEYYEADFHPFYHEKKFDFLLDLNAALLETLNHLLDQAPKMQSTAQYVTTYEDHKDYRQVLHPKRKDTAKGNFVEYHQVFSDRSGFIPQLSVVDLLFNEGPAASGFLIS